MRAKLMVLMAECVADANPTMRWKRPFIGVLPVAIGRTAQMRVLQKSVVPPYKLMCAAIDDAIHARYLQAVLDDIAEVESGRIEVIEEETEGWLFWIRSNAVTFEGKFDQGSGGEVTLEQFKLAVSTFRDFLNDPERKPVEILFPDEQDGTTVGR